MDDKIQAWNGVERRTAEDRRDGEDRRIAARTTIVIGGETMQLSALKPLTLGDKRKLFKVQGIDLSKLMTFDPEQEFQFAFYLLKMMRPATTEAEAEETDLTALRTLILGSVEASRKKVAPRPTSTLSPSLPGGTDGAKPT